MIKEKEPIIYGLQIDGKSRCVHYSSELDVVAIQMKCCMKFYACIECHNELENHQAHQWAKSEFSEKAIICGNCQCSTTITEYLQNNKCLNCIQHFNPKCKTHHHLYFKI